MKTRAFLVAILVGLLTNAVGQVGPAVRETPSVDMLIQNLRSADDLVRIDAAQKLGAAKSTAAVEPLIMALGDKEPRVRAEAATALGKIGDRRAINPLIQLANDQDDDVKASVFGALGAFKDDRVSACLVAALESLRNSSETTSQDSRTTMVEMAITAVGKVGNEHAINPLAEILHGNTWNEAFAAADALKKLNWQPKTEADQVYFFVGIHDEAQIDARWEAVKRVLIKDLGSFDFLVKSRAFEFLVDREKPDVIKPLIEALQNNGDPTMAETFVNSSNKELKQAAEDWANEHHYQILAPQ